MNTLAVLVVLPSGTVLETHPAREFLTPEEALAFADDLAASECRGSVVEVYDEVSTLVHSTYTWGYPRVTPRRYPQ